VKSTPIAAAGTARNGKRSFGVRYRPVNSTARLFGNDLETISAHWPMVMGTFTTFYRARPNRQGKGRNGKTGSEHSSGGIDR
jgi:hypothetical protein